MWNYSEIGGGGGFAADTGYAVAFGKDSDGNHLWVAVGDDNPGDSNSVLISTDGKFWGDVTGSPPGLEARGVAYTTRYNSDNVRWVVGGLNSASQDNKDFSYSVDGRTWLNTGVTYPGDGGTRPIRGVAGKEIPIGVDLVKAGSNIERQAALWVATGDTGTGNSYGNILYSHDGSVWENSKPGETFSRAYDVAFGETENGTSMWIAVGETTIGNSSGNIKYSYDGQVWYSEDQGVSFNTGRGVAYGLSSDGITSMWVATGFEDGNNFGNIKYSYDGLSWSNSLSSGTSFGVSGHKVAFGTSSNGTSPMWIAVGDNGSSSDSSILFSYDGVSWDLAPRQSGLFGVYASDVAFGVSSDQGTPMWVAVGHVVSGQQIAYSYDGLSWSSHQGENMNQGLHGVAFGVSSQGTSAMWVAVGDNGTGGGNDRNVLYSYNGISWSQITETGAEFNLGEGRGVVFGKKEDGTSMFVAVGDHNTTDHDKNIAFANDTNLNDWEYVTTIPDNGTTYKGYGVEFSRISEGVLKARSGISAPVYPPPPPPPIPLTVRWILGGRADDATVNTTKNLWYSFDGISWSESRGDNPLQIRADGVAFGVSSDGTSMWVATGVQNSTVNTDNPNNIAYSYNGISWSNSSSSGTCFLQGGRGVAFGTSSNGTSPMWVAVGNNGTGNTEPGNDHIMYSYDGISWSSSSSEGSSFRDLGNSVAFGVSTDLGTPMWIAGGKTSGTGQILYSYDGISWSEASINDTIEEVNGINFGTSIDGINPMWTAATNSLPVPLESILWSLNGIDWNPITGNSFTAASTHAIAYGTSSDGVSPMWVAGGDDTGTLEGIMYSYDGISWSKIPEKISSSEGVFKKCYSVAYGTCTTNPDQAYWIATGEGANASTSNRSRKAAWSNDGICWTYFTSTEFPTATEDSAKFFIGEGAISDKENYGISRFRAGVIAPVYPPPPPPPPPPVPLSIANWVAVGRNVNGDRNGNIKYSFDGISWSDSAGVGFDDDGYGGGEYGTTADENTRLWVVAGESINKGNLLWKS